MEPVEFQTELLRLKLAAATSSREDLDVVLTPLSEQMRTSHEASIKYAEQGIKTCFTLNGGALVLFSGFAALFKVNPATVVIALVCVSSAFIVGLILACVTGYFAYRSAKAEMRVAMHKLAATTLVHLLSDNEKKLGETEKNPQIKAQRDSAQTFSVRAERDIKWAIAFGAGSLLAFLAGTLIGGWTLMTHAGSV